MNKLDFENRTAVVTGGAAGIGLAIARRLAAGGARVSLWDRDADALRASAASVGDAHSVALDVADATAAVDSLTVDWNEQATRSAKQYLSISGFSCKGLIHQLSSSAGDGYTASQATYGAKQAGACG